MSIEDSFDFLSDYYNKKHTKKKKNFYLHTLNKYPEITVKKALNEYMETAIYFPKLPELTTLLIKHNTVKETADDSMRYLWMAYNILVKADEYEFTQYCDRVNMPQDDRERVICKMNTS